MASGNDNSQAHLNEFQATRLRVTCEYIDKVIGEMEEVLHSDASKAAFPKYQEDLTAEQRRTLENYFARIRAQLVRVLDRPDMPRPDELIPVSRAMYTSLTAIDIAVEELKPRYMRGYGAISPTLATDLEEISSDLRASIAEVNQYLRHAMPQDLKSR